MEWYGREVVGLSSYLLVLAIFDGAALAAVKPIDQAFFDNWTGQQYQKSVADGSVLTEYQGLTEADNWPGMQFRVSFSPRFQCTPMISFLAQGTGLEASVDGSGEVDELPELRDDDRLGFRIDGQSVEYKLIVDTLEKDRLIWNFNGDESARQTLVLKMDVSRKASVMLDEGRTITFSLLGSRKTLKALQTLCFQHDPIPFDG